MAYNGDLLVAEGLRQSQRVAHQIQATIGQQVAIVCPAGAAGAAVTALVRCDDMVTGLGQWLHDATPTVSQFRKAVQKQDAGSTGLFVAGFEEMHVQAVDPLDIPTANALR